MNARTLSFFCLLAGLALHQPAVAQTNKVLLQDDFERTEKNDAVEQVGNGWSTNSRTRAKGNKQVDLKDGAMYIFRHEVADHGVSVVHDLNFQDATIALRFKIGAKDDLGINIADMKEKSVHAGHICVARIRANRVDIADLKTGNMKLEHREARKSGKLSPELKKELAKKTKQFKTDIAADKWHSLVVKIQGDEMSVKIDEQVVGTFQSEGIAHPTKRRLRLAVNRNAWVDDVVVTRLK